MSFLNLAKQYQLSPNFDKGITSKLHPLII